VRGVQAKHHTRNCARARATRTPPSSSCASWHSSMATGSGCAGCSPTTGRGTSVHSTSVARRCGSATPAHDPITPGPMEGSSVSTERSSASACRRSSSMPRRNAILLDVAYYNAERLHTGLGGHPPLERLRRRGVTHVRESSASAHGHVWSLRTRLLVRVEARWRSLRAGRDGARRRRLQRDSQHPDCASRSRCAT